MQRQTTSYAGRSLSVLFASFAALAHALLPLTAQENRAFTFDQDAQSLSTALDAFSEATGVRVLAPSSALKGKTAPALNGDLSAGVALETLLAGSGLESEFVSDESVAIRRPASIRKESYIQLDSITVKGELQERSLLETNTSVNIQTGADIARSNDKRISDVFSRAANVNINGSGLQAFSFSIRGINSSGVGGSGNGALASLTVDGAAFTTQQLARGYNSLFDIEQVEILRGPQSTSQARNSLAGAVVVQTKDPEFVQDTQAVALIGDYGNYEFGVANTGPLNKEFAYRVAFQRTNSDGFIENPVLGTDSYNYSDTDTLRTKLLYQPESSPLEIVLGYTHVQADARNDVSSWFPETQQYINSNPYGEGGMDTEQDVATLSVSYDLSDRWTLQSQLAYNEFVSADLNSTYATSVPDRDQAWFATADQKEWNETLRFNYGGEKLRGTLGVFYSEDTNIVLREGVALQNAFGSGLDADVEIDSPADTDTQAFFGEFDFDATDRVTITLGGRYEKVDIATVSSTVANLILPPPAPYTVIQPGIIDASVNASTDFDVFLPKFGITYALDKEQRLGFTYSEGYRQGGVTADPTTLQIGQYEPEFVKNYEVSYKGAFENGLSFSSNVFYLDWKDQQVLEQALGSPFTRTVNAGKSTVYGGELELAWRNTQWDTYATFGYNHSEFDEFVSSGNDLSGNAFPSSPSVTAAVGGFYSIDKWVYGAEVNYRDGNYTSVDNAFETDSLTLVDLSVSYEFERFTVRGFVNNAFDEIIQVNETFVIEGIPHGNFTAPRTIGLQVMFGY